MWCYLRLCTLLHIDLSQAVVKNSPLTLFTEYQLLDPVLILLELLFSR